MAQNNKWSRFNKAGGKLLEPLSGEQLKELEMLVKLEGSGAVKQNRATLAAFLQDRASIRGAMLLTNGTGRVKLSERGEDGYQRVEDISIIAGFQAAVPPSLREIASTVQVEDLGEVKDFYGKCEKAGIKVFRGLPAGCEYDRNFFDGTDLVPDDIYKGLLEMPVRIYDYRGPGGLKRAPKCEHQYGDAHLLYRFGRSHTEYAQRGAPAILDEKM